MILQGRKAYTNFECGLITVRAVVTGSLIDELKSSGHGPVHVLWKSWGNGRAPRKSVSLAGTISLLICMHCTLNPSDPSQRERHIYDRNVG